MSDDLYADDPHYAAGGARKPTAKERAEEKRIAAERNAQITALMSTKLGRALAWRWLGEAGIFRTSFAAGMPDVTAHNEGFRKFGLMVQAEILEAVPDRFWLMVKENSGNKEQGE
jgi:hypothetical protein